MAPRLTPEQQETIFNTCPLGSRILAVCVPTRAIRVIVLDGDLVYRVEQLDPTNWTWRVLSTHSEDTPWQGWGAAITDAIAKQARLKEKIKLAMHERNMAQIKAQETS
jgi:hypothetical protein